MKSKISKNYKSKTGYRLPKMAVDGELNKSRVVTTPDYDVFPHIQSTWHFRRGLARMAIKRGTDGGAKNSSQTACLTNVLWIMFNKFTFTWKEIKKWKIAPPDFPEDRFQSKQFDKMSENHPLCNARRNMLLQEPMTNGPLVAVNCARFCRSVLRNLKSTDLKWTTNFS